MVGEVTYEFGGVDDKSSNDLAEETNINTAKSESNSAENESNAAKMFEERQRKFLYGRRVSSDILDSSGAIITAKGTLIDDVVLTLVKEKGKMVDLVMNNTK